MDLISCDLALAEMNEVDNAADPIMLDFYRTFDKVDHTILCQKLFALIFPALIYPGLLTSQMTKNTLLFLFFSLITCSFHPTK